MNDKLASLSRDRSTPSAIFIRVAIMVFLICLGIAAASAFMLPERYFSEAKLLVKFISGPHEDNANLTKTQLEASAALGQRVMQTELAMFHKDGVLAPVIDKLHLKEVWGKKYTNGSPLKHSEALEMLRQRLIVASDDALAVIDVKVFGDDKNEPQAITQAILESYFEYSKRIHQTETPDMHRMENELKDLRLKIYELTDKTKLLRQQLHIAKEAISIVSSEEQPYWDAKNNLAKLDQEYRKQTAELEAAHMAQAFAPGTISNIAVFQAPTPHPVMIKSKIIFYGGVGGIFLGMMAGGAAALVAARRGARPPQTVVPALS